MLLKLKNENDDNTSEIEKLSLVKEVLLGSKTMKKLTHSLYFISKRYTDCLVYIRLFVREPAYPVCTVGM
jgi:hypothetical protein